MNRSIDKKHVALFRTITSFFLQCYNRIPFLQEQNMLIRVRLHARESESEAILLPGGFIENEL